MAQKLTTSARIGTGSINHNNRKFIAKNVDSTRSNQNIVFVQKDIKKVYHQLFDTPLKAYNEKQTRKDRIIPDYYEHIKNSQRLKLYHEVVFQIGNKDFHDKELQKNMLCQFMQDFQKNNPNLEVFNAVLHMDEATPHLHIDFVPVATRQKQGLSKKVSLKGALAEQGILGKDKKHTEWQVWCDAQKKILGDIAISHGFEVEHKDVSRAHLNCDDYREQRQLVDKTKKEVSNYQQELQNTKNQVDLLKDEVIQLNQQKEYYNNLLDLKSKLELEVSTILNDITKLNYQQNTLIYEISKLTKNKNSSSTEVELLNNQVNSLKSQIVELETQQTKILNPTQICEFKISKGFGNKAIIKSVGNHKGNESIYLQQIINTAKNIEDIRNSLYDAISQRDKAVSEFDELSKEFNNFKDDTEKKHLNDITNVKLQTNNERNQLNLLRKVLNIPKDIDTYDKLHRYLYHSGKNQIR